MLLAWVVASSRFLYKQDEEETIKVLSKKKKMKTRGKTKKTKKKQEKMMKNVGLNVLFSKYKESSIDINKINEKMSFQVETKGDNNKRLFMYRSGESFFL